MSNYSFIDKIARKSDGRLYIIKAEQDVIDKVSNYIVSTYSSHLYIIYSTTNCNSIVLEIRFFDDISFNKHSVKILKKCISSMNNKNRSRIKVKDLRDATSLHNYTKIHESIFNARGYTIDVDDYHQYYVCVKI